MRSRQRIVTSTVVAAIALCASVAAASASATDRAFKCEPVPLGTGTFLDAHCLTPTLSGSFKHVLIPGTDGISLSNAKTSAGTTAASLGVMKGHIAGVETAVACRTITGSGSLTNGATSVSGTGKVAFSGCTVTLPAGKGCKVTGGVVTTKELKASTAGTTGTRVKFEPASGTEFATVPIEGCEKERPPKGSYVVEGAVEAPVSGATTVATHSEITAQGTLLFGGTAAGLEGAITTVDGEAGVVLTP